MEELLTARQVAELLKVKPQTIVYLHKTRQIRGIIIARKLRFTRKAVEVYVKHCEERA